MPVFGDFTQTVTIDGLAALVHDLSIKVSSSQRVASIDFVIEHLEVTGQSFAYSAAAIGAIVIVQQTVGATTESWTATVVDVNEKRTSDYSFKRLQCRSLEYDASGTRFLDLWEKAEASTLVMEAWQRHAANNLALQFVSLAGVDTNTTIIEEYSSEFGSLYDLMEEVCLLTGWAWKLRDGTLYFFDPLLNLGPDIDQSALRIERDTIDLKVSLQGVYNVYRMQAWQYTTLSIGRTFEPGDCVDGFQFDPALLQGVEVVGTPPIKQQQWKDEGLKVDTVDGDGILRLNKSVVATQSLQGPLTIDLTVRRLVWVERLDEISILQYGRRDAPPLSDNGGMNIAAATQFLDTMLGYRATPAADLTLSVLGVGWQPDMVIDVFLDDPVFSAALYITDVTRTTDGSDLFVSITLTSPSEVIEGEQVQVGARRSRSRVDPAYEIGRRLERLERKVAHPAQPLGQSTGIFGVFGGSYGAAQTSGWQQTIALVFPAAGAISEAQGWQQVITVDIAPAQIQEAYGWQQVITADITAAPIQEAYGWSTTTVAGFVSTIVVTTGWSQGVTFQLLGDGGGTGVDDDVGMPGGGTGVDDDVGIAGTIVDDEVSFT